MSEQIPTKPLAKSQTIKGEPTVSVIMPVRNEAGYIRRSLGAVLSQDYPREKIEVIIVDGMSDDQTREIVQQLQRTHPNLKLVNNPRKIVPTGLNAALVQAKGDIIVRVDGHCKIAPDYIRRCVQHLQEERVDCVGGPIETIGESSISRSIALAMSSPFGVGGSAFRTVKNRSMIVDTVAFPAYTREAIARTGPFDEELVRNQDDEYNYRLRKMGGKILLSPDIRSIYYSRSSLQSLWRQYYQYGFWKVRVMQKHPEQMSIRQLVPPVFVLALLSVILGGLLYPASLPVLGMVVGIYLLANLSASIVDSARAGWQHLAILPAAFTILHTSYGAGFLTGLLRFGLTSKANRAGNSGKTGFQATAAAMFAFARVKSARPAGAPSIGKLLDAALRRGMDIVLSLLGLLLLSPVFFLVSILIKRDSPGPVFYQGPRAGKGGKIFHIWKFRTMVETNESRNGPRVTAQDDPRITPLGRILRDTKLNELPQVWNVLRGDMSLVGPRPEDPVIASQWPEDVRREVLSVRPGITSPASVVYRNEETLLQSGNLMGMYLKEILPSKLRLDQLYVRNRSILTDLDVILWTFLLLIPQQKRRTIPEHLLYWGPLSLFFDRYLVWFITDTIVAFISVGIAGVIWRIGAPLDVGVEKAIGIALSIALLFSLINTLMGLNHVNWKRSQTQDAMNLAISSGAVTLVLFGLNLVWPGGPLLPPSMLIVAGTIAFNGFVVARYRSRLFIEVFIRRLRLPGNRIGTLGERVLIVGSGEMGQAAARLIRSGDLAQAFNIIGMVDDDPRKIGSQIDGCRVIGDTHSIPALVEKHDVGLILFSISKIQPAEQNRILAQCQSTPARIMMMPEILELLHALFPRDKKESDRLIERVLSNAVIERQTGLNNQNQFLWLVEQELPRARRYGRPFSIILLTTGYFPPEGVAVSPAVEFQILKEIAARVRNNVRSVDILGRFDGNEFAIALPETNQEGACLVAERTKNIITETPIRIEHVSYLVTAKFGVATAEQGTIDIHSLLENARIDTSAA